MKRDSKILIIGGIVFALGPLGIALLGYLLSYVFSCAGGRGGPGVCAIGGSSMGEIVWTMEMMHWISLLTFLPGMGILFAGIIHAVVMYFRSKNTSS